MSDTTASDLREPVRLETPTEGISRDSVEAAPNWNYLIGKIEQILSTPGLSDRERVYDAAALAMEAYYYLRIRDRRWTSAAAEVLRTIPRSSGS